MFNSLDSTCSLIGQQVCFHSAMKHKNDVCYSKVFNDYCDGVRATLFFVEVSR